MMSLDKNWCIFEDGIDRERMKFQEAVFTLGNGYIGSRGILEEGYEDAYAGTYFAGVYSRGGAESFEIVNAPNPFCLEVYVDGKKLSAGGMKVIKHKRALDLKRALLARHTIFEDGGKRYEYESMRFVGIRNIHSALLTFSFKSTGGDAEVSIRQRIDGTTKNAMRPVGGPVKHYAIARKTERDGMLYLEGKTGDLNISVGMASFMRIKRRGIKSKSKMDSSGETIEREFFLSAKRGITYRFNVYVSFYTSQDVKDTMKACFNELNQMKKRGDDLILKQHTREWENRWRVSDVGIKGDAASQLALRFNIYHMLIAGPPENKDSSIAAKTLSGEWYKGHVFWDTEIYILPFFIFNHPETARRLLLYRARRLEKAKNGAAAQGYKGALWPWESALSGEDETPDRWVNFDGTVIPVHNKKREHHIAADVIYGLSLYHKATADDSFMIEQGLNMVFETARFWASRVKCNEGNDTYEIRDVIGPNEFQECVNNNSYTNYMAKWLMDYAADLHSIFAERYPDMLKALTEKMGLDEKEVRRWKSISRKLLFLQEKNGLVEEFEGYFQRKDVILKKFDKNGMPLWPSDVQLKDVKDTQLIKQADVVLLLYLFSSDFSTKDKKVNFEYYQKRTTHKSSLSASSYAIIGAELHKVERAYKYFLAGVNSDLKNVYGNTGQGIHAASLGGAWQVVINGFAGIRLENGKLVMNPRLPEKWKELKFRIWYNKALLQFTVAKKRTRALIVEDRVRKRRGMDIVFCGKKHVLTRKALLLDH